MTKSLETKIRNIYADRFDTKLVSVDSGADRVFGGKLFIVTYVSSPEERVSDVVYVNKDEEPIIFNTTQELILFLQKKSFLLKIDAIFESKLFPGIVFIFVLCAILWVGNFQGQANDTVLAILGSVAGLAAGFFFGAGRKN